MTNLGKTLTCLTFAGSMILLATVLWALVSRSFQPESAASAEAYQIQQETIAMLKDEIADLRAQVKAAEEDRDTQFASVVELTDKLHGLQGVGPRLSGGPGSGPRADDNAPLPKVRGEVTTIGSNGLVEISLGSDDGLRAGHELDVFRRTTYMGRIKVLKTTPDRAVGGVFKEPKEGKIEKGDRVTTFFQN